mgnify:CR=1 FL=1
MNSIVGNVSKVNYQQPAFRGSKLRQIGNKIGESKFVEKLSLESHTKNANYIKGMLKALKELGLVK